MIEGQMKKKVFYLKVGIGTSTPRSGNPVVVQVVIISDNGVVMGNKPHESDFGFGTANLDYSPNGEMGKIMNPNFRNSHKDSFGNNFEITWHPEVDQTINDANSEGDWTYIYKYIKDTWGSKIELYGDSIGWHHHQYYKTDSGWGSYDSGPFEIWKPSLEQALCHLIIDQQFFPSSYRAGWNWEDTEFSNWIENYIPFAFDAYSAPGRYRSFIILIDTFFSSFLHVNLNLNDLIKRKGRWKHFSWQPYCPSKSNVFDKGNMNRWINRIESNTRTQSSVNSAFKEAKRGNKVNYPVYGHVSDDFSTEIDELQIFLDRASQKYGIKFKYATVQEAMRYCLNGDDTNPPSFTLTHDDNYIYIESSKSLFGPQPFACIKINGAYIPVNLTFNGINKWKYDISHVKQRCIFGVGGSDKLGNTNTELLIINN